MREYLSQRTSDFCCIKRLTYEVEPQNPWKTARYEYGRCEPQVMAAEKNNKRITTQGSGFYWNKRNMGAEGELNKKYILEEE